MNIRAINFAKSILANSQKATDVIPRTNDNLVYEVSRAACQSFIEVYDGDYEGNDKIRPEAPLTANAVRLETAGAVLSDHHDVMFGDGVIAKIRKFELGLEESEFFEEVRIFVGRKRKQYQVVGGGTTNTYTNDQILIGVAYGNGKFDWQWEDVNEVPTAKNQLNHLQKIVREIVISSRRQSSVDLILHLLNYSAEQRNVKP